MAVQNCWSKQGVSLRETITKLHRELGPNLFPQNDPMVQLDPTQTQSSPKPEP